MLFYVLVCSLLMTAWNNNNIQNYVPIHRLIWSIEWILRIRLQLNKKSQESLWNKCCWYILWFDKINFNSRLIYLLKRIWNVSRLGFYFWESFLLFLFRAIQRNVSIEFLWNNRLFHRALRLLYSLFII